jgi:hypothetical protein
MNFLFIQIILYHFICITVCSKEQDDSLTLDLELSYVKNFTVERNLIIGAAVPGEKSGKIDDDHGGEPASLVCEDDIVNQVDTKLKLINSQMNCGNVFDMVTKRNQSLTGLCQDSYFAITCCKSCRSILLSLI